MCVRTKTSYGCGHVYKSTNDCYSSACDGIDRFHYMKEGDCRECRKEGVNVSRGKDGKGRYAQKLKSSKPRDKSYSSSAEVLSSEREKGSVTSPWAPQDKPEKTWESPHRRQADEAWLSEHDDRISDLQDRFGTFNLSDKQSRPKYSKELVIASKDYDDDEDNYDQYDKYDKYDEDEEDYVFVHETPTKKHHPIEARRHTDGKIERSHSHRHQDRQYSHDSLPDSMPSYRSSPKMRKASTLSVVNTYPEASQEYDYYHPSGRAAPKHHHRRHQHGSNRSRKDSYPDRYDYESDYEVNPAPPPLHMPPPAVPMYDNYEYYSPGNSPAGPHYVYSEYPYEVSHPPPRQQHYDHYRRY